MPLIDTRNSELYNLSNVTFSIVLLVTMITTLAICSCCGRNKSQKDEEDCTYGVVTDQRQPASDVESPDNKPINFRPNVSNGRTERHSQPTGSKNTTSTSAVRASAPMQTGRALPEVPSELYTVINKSRKNSEICFADDTIQPVYESIDPETDSFVDPMYSKMDEVRPQNVASSRDRRYDYPIFPGRREVARNEFQDDTLYQSASQIYAPGSEDPYSSINSEPRRVVLDGDVSDTYDPGYAKVKPAKEKPKVESTERELDILYSKIRRRNEYEADQPGPSRLEPLPPLQNLTSSVVTDPVQPQFDEMSVSSREPSYRYITIRENANIVRERLLNQGQLTIPIREHYYSTIGNDYETVDNPENQQLQRPREIPVVPLDSLTVSLNHDESHAPPPPTSPIPDRTPSLSVAEMSLQGSRSQEGSMNAMYSTVVKQRNDLPANEVILRAPTSALPNINEFMTRPTLPYNVREYSMSKSYDDSQVETTFDVNENAPSTSNTRHSLGPTVEDIISARRYRSSAFIDIPAQNEKK